MPLSDCDLTSVVQKPISVSNGTQTMPKMLWRGPASFFLSAVALLQFLNGTTGNSSNGNNRLAGGLEAEQKAREEYQTKAQEEQSANFEALQAIRRESFRKASASASPDRLTATWIIWIVGPQTACMM